MQNHWFTSDFHLSHSLMLRPEVCDRPWNTVDEMDQALIESVNNYVKSNDILYFLGDFAFKREKVELLSKLNGQVFFIYGNHDKKIQTNILKEMKNIVWWGNIKDIKLDDQKITLCHFMMSSWNCSHWGAWHLYGHHHKDVSTNSQGKTMNVGVDLNNYNPIHFDQVKEYMKQRPDNWDLIKH